MARETRQMIRRLLLLVPIVWLLILIGHKLELHLTELEHWVQTLGFWAPLGFIGLFVVLTPLVVSADVLCFAAGLLFSISDGLFYIIIATYLAAALIFVLGRYLFRQKVASFIARNKKFAALNAALANQAFKLMFLLRLTPLPFAMLSYAFSIAPVRFWPYLAATSGIFIYNLTLVYIGYATKHIAGWASDSSVHPAVPYPLLAAGLLFTLGIVFYVSKLAGKALKDLDVDNVQEK